MNWLARLLFPEIFQRMEQLMATVDQLIEAVANEKAEVQEKLNALQNEIQALKDQIANGGTVTEEQLESVLSAVQNIFVPEPEGEEDPN